MKISIITICYNSSKTIEQTIQSVLKQDYKNIEYIIKDGGSKDDTMKIVESYESKFDGRLKYVSTRDNGLYDAMNVGIKMATGDIIGLLNSDDILASENIISKIAAEFENKSCDVVYSNLLFMDQETMSIPVRNFISHKLSKKLGWHPPHPTLYLKKEIYNTIGLFNTNYRIAADYDFMLRLIKSNYIFCYVNEYFVFMRSGGISTNGIKGYIKSLKESHMVLKTNNIKFPLLSNFVRILKTFYQGLDARINKNKIIKSFPHLVDYEKKL